MRIIVPLLLIVLLVAACDQSAQTGIAIPTEETSYSPDSFRADIERLIAQRDYQAAMRLLKVANVERQVGHDGSGYLAVAQDMIVLPGVYPEVEFDRVRDWVFPGTSDVIENAAWQQAATEFATRYNRVRADA